MLAIGFIGAGGRAANHMDALDITDGAAVTAVCDIDEETARAAAEPRNASVYTDHETMYRAEDDLDAVFITLPPFAHTNQEIMAAERGLDLFVEKPLALTNTKAHEISEAIDRNDCITSVGYQIRYADVVDRAQSSLDGRELALIEGHYRCDVPGHPGHWWREYERSGGQIVEQVTHIYDLVRLLGGDVESVSAIGNRQIVTEIDFEDVVSANLVHENGTISNVTSTCAASRYSSGIRVVGDGVRLELDQHSLSGIVDGEEIAMKVGNDPTLTAVERFVEAVRTRDSSAIRSDYADAMDSFALTLAVEESLETGAAVPLR